MVLKETIPAQSEIREFMGSSMAEVFFSYCHPDSKRLLGIMQPEMDHELHEEDRKSSSDQSTQKAALTPQLTNKYEYIQEITHQEILAIGQKVMEKNECDLYNKMLKTHDEQGSEARNMFEAEKRRAVQLAENQIRFKYENIIETLRGHFEQELQNALTAASEKCTQSLQKAVVKTRVEVTRMNLMKLRKEISYVINSIHESFEDKMRAQKENMIADFNQIIRQELAKTEKRIKDLERTKDEAMQLQRHELEMQNFADVAYILCSERMRCSSEKEEMQLCFEKRIEALEKLLAEANNTLHSLRNDSVAEETDQSSWNKKLLDVVREFQKFINFAFKAVPGQAEFLLSLESLLTDS